MTEKTAIIYDRQRFFFLKRLLNAYLDAHPVLKPAQKHLEVLLAQTRDWQVKTSTIQQLMMTTNDPITITVLGMNMDILRVDKPPVRLD